MFGVIYKITNLLNGKCYIGQTIAKNPILRWRAHCSKKVNSAIHLAIVKYGKNNFKFEIIEQNKTIEELNLLEQFYIKKYDTMSPNGYNLDIGGRNCLKEKASIEKGAAKKRGMAYKNRRKGIIAINSLTGETISVEVVKDFLKYGFSKANCSNIRTVLARKTKRTKVKDYYFIYNIQANQNLIEEVKRSSAVQRIEIETLNKENKNLQET